MSSASAEQSTQQLRPRPPHRPHVLLDEMPLDIVQQLGIRVHRDDSPIPICAQLRVHILQHAALRVPWLLDFLPPDGVHDVDTCKVGGDGGIAPLDADQMIAFCMHHHLQLVVAVPPGTPLLLFLSQKVQRADRIFSTNWNAQG